LSRFEVSDRLRGWHSIALRSPCDRDKSSFISLAECSDVPVEPRCSDVSGDDPLAGGRRRGIWKSAKLSNESYTARAATSVDSEGSGVTLLCSRPALLLCGKEFYRRRLGSTPGFQSLLPGLDGPIKLQALPTLVLGTNLFNEWGRASNFVTRIALRA
jgi:hypothetical protein